MSGTTHPCFSLLPPPPKYLKSNSNNRRPGPRPSLFPPCSLPSGLCLPSLDLISWPSFPLADTGFLLACSPHPLPFLRPFSPLPLFCSLAPFCSSCLCVFLPVSPCLHALLLRQPFPVPSLSQVPGPPRVWSPPHSHTRLKRYFYSRVSVCCRVRPWVLCEEEDRAPEDLCRRPGRQGRGEEVASTTGPPPHGSLPPLLGRKEAAKAGDTGEMNHPEPRGRCPLRDEVTACQLESSPSTSLGRGCEPLDSPAAAQKRSGWRYKNQNSACKPCPASPVLRRYSNPEPRPLAYISGLTKSLSRGYFMGWSEN